MPAYSVKVTTAGAAGSASGSAQTEHIEGVIEAIHLNYTGLPATTDVTIAEVSPPGRTLLTVADSNTDDTLYPSITDDDTAGVAQTTRRPFYVSSRLTVSVAQGDAATDGLIATIVVRAGEGARI